MNPIETYMDTLRRQLSGADPAIVQDALYDAHEHLYGATDELKREHPDAPLHMLMDQAVEQYGDPEEIAQLYRAQVSPSLPGDGPSPSLLRAVVGVVIDPAAWGAVLYLLLSLATGILYFTWAVTGLSLSMGFMVLIIGVPFFGLFLASVKGFALFEGKIVQLLLGERMPTRPLLNKEKKGLWEQFKGWLGDRYTWSALAYLVLMLPLGVLFFSLAISFLSLSLGLMAAPVAHGVFHHQVLQFPGHETLVAPWMYYAMPFLGILFFIGTLHLAKLLGQTQARFAKWMLVRG